LGLTGKDGNDAARAAVIRHIENRRYGQMRIADLPEYRFSSRYELKLFTFDTDEGVFAEFRCDGKILHYEKNVQYQISGGFDTALEFKVPEKIDEHIKLDIPVRCVRSVDSTRGTGGYSHGEGYFAYLKLNPSCGHESLAIDLTLMTYSREMEKYLVCLPTLLPEPEDSLITDDQYAAASEPLLELNAPDV
jgi:hypothetical protein